MKRNKLVLFLSMVMVAMIAATLHTSPAAVGAFKVTDLIGSAGSGGKKKDPHMINAWGNAFFEGNPFWINDEGTGVSELIDGRGTIFNALPLVTIPGVGHNIGRPTGIVANSTGQFALSAGGSALFIFASEDGTITGWNQGLGSKAVVAVDNSGKASYTGLALAKNGDANLLYASNFGVQGHPGSIDVFDSNFNPVTPAGGFIDPNLPANFEPYNITALGANLFVAYAKGQQAVGQVDEFDPTGTLVAKFTDPSIAEPWGLAIAPQNFGPFSGDLLVGNLADGTISTFNLHNQEFLGQLADTNGKKIVIAGLWSLVDGTGAMNAPADTVYFTAGPKGYAAGLFGMIQAVAPKPTKVPKPTRTPKPTKTPKPRATPTQANMQATATPPDPQPSATMTYVYPY